MKIFAFSDLHLDEAAAGRVVAEAAEADLVIGAGDFADKRRGLAAFMTRLGTIAAKAVYVPGNNESLEELTGVTTACVLHGEAETVAGLRIAGLGGGVPPKPGAEWPSWDLTEAEAEAALAGIEAADILVLHSPPKELGDDHGELGRIGSDALRRAVERIAPRLCVFGHVHDCWGEAGEIGATEWRNLGPRGHWFEFG